MRTVLQTRSFVAILLVVLLGFPPSALAAVADITNLASWTHPADTWSNSTAPGFQWQESYDWEPSLIGSLPAPPPIHKVALSGGAAYIAGDSGLQVVDITDPTAPVTVGTWAGGVTLDVAVAGSLAYAVGDSGLSIIDVSDSTNPTLVGDCSIPFARAVALSGTTAYVVDLSGKLLVIDVFAPATPVHVNAFQLVDAGSSVDAEGSSLYLTTASSLYVFDIVDPGNPLQKGSITLTDGGDVTAVGSTAYVADGPAGLKVVNCTDPVNPQLMGAIDTPGDATDVVVSGTIAFVADGAGGLQLVNVSNPAQPTMSGTYDTSGVSSGVAVSDSTVCVADTAGLLVLDATRPTGLDLVGEYHTSPWYNARDIAFIGNTACIPAAGAGVKFVDVSNPAAPTPIFTLDTPGSATGIDTVGTTVYVGDGANGLVIIDASTPAAPSIVGTCAAASSAGDVDVEGTTAYIAAGGVGVRVVDVSDPTKPTLINTFGFTTGQRHVRDVLVDGSIAYIADYGFLHIVDVSDPTAPVLLKAITNIYGSEISLDGDRLYVAAWSTGINVFDVSDPANASLIGRYTPPAGQDVYHATGLGRMMLVGRMTSLELVDMYDPARPRVVASRHIGDYTTKVVVRGGRAYLAAALPGLQIFDLGFDTGFSYDLTGAPAVPDTSEDGFSAVAGYSGIDDGSWHFNVRAAVGLGPWGAANSVLAQIDTMAPLVVVEIDEGAAYATGLNVTLGLTALDTLSGVASMRISNDGTFDTEPWEPFAASKPWTLSPGDGAKTVYVQCRDAAGNVSSTETDSITLDSTPPTLGNDTALATEDETLTVPAPGILSNDSDFGGVVTSATVVTPPAGNLVLNSDGSFAYRAATDFWGTDTFTYRASDGRLWSDPATVTITVAPVNDAPSFTKGSDVAVEEHTGLHTISEWATGISPGPANESEQQLAFAVEHDNAALFAAPPTLDPISGDLTFTLAPDVRGSSACTATLTDDSTAGGPALSHVETFTVTVTQANAAPSFTKGADVAVDEDHGAYLEQWASDISAGPASESGQVLSFETTNSNPALFDEQPTVTANGRLGFTPTADANGSAECTVTLTDDDTEGGPARSHVETFAITITAVNDAPSFVPGDSITVDEDSGAYSQPWASHISAGPANESGQALSFETTNSHPALFHEQPTVAADGSLQFTPAQDANGVATVTTTLTDDDTAGGPALSMTRTFIITVSPVDDSTQIHILSSSQVLARYGSSYTFMGRLECDGVPVVGCTVTLQYSYDGVTFGDGGTSTTAADGSFAILATPSRTVFYRASFEGEANRYLASDSQLVKVTPKAFVGVVRAPRVMYAKTASTAYGYLKPRHTAGTKAVRIYRYRYESGSWKSYGYVRATASDYRGYTKYAASVALPKTGRWRLRAYVPATSQYASTWSGSYDYVTVKATGDRAVAIAKRYIGTPYRWGGNGPESFDSSGFTRYVYAQMGVSLPRTALWQYRYGPRVSTRSLKPGDLLFFGSSVSYVGIYVGDGKMIYCNRPGGSVRIRRVHGGLIGATRPLNRR